MLDTPFTLAGVHLYVSVMITVIAIALLYLSINHKRYDLSLLIIVLYVLQLIFTPLRYAEIRPDPAASWRQPLTEEPPVERVHVPAGKDRMKALEAKTEENWRIINEN
jgi:hypothetical protein